MRTFVLLASLLLFSLSSFCQQAFTLKIRLPATFPLNRLDVSYNNGITETDIRKDSVKHEMVITGNLRSLYGNVSLILVADSISPQSGALFFFGAGNSSIDILSENSLTDARLVNALDVKENGKDKMDVYCKKELNTVTDFMRKNESQFGTDSALLHIAIRKVDTLYKKQLSFITDNPSIFYSFWLYHRLLTPLLHTTPTDTLMMVFQRFPDNYKNTEEGQYILNILQKQDVMKNRLIAADFNVLDINRDTINLKKLKGRYVILDFWATWCVPCMKAMPSLVKISGQYSPDKLTVLSVSLDRDTVAYTKKRQRLPQSWKYIFGDDSIAKIYGVIAIPVLYLIDPEGKVLFTSNSGLPEEYMKLEKILKERLKNPS